VDTTVSVSAQLRAHCGPQIMVTSFSPLGAACGPRATDLPITSFSINNKTQKSQLKYEIKYDLY